MRELIGYKVVILPAPASRVPSRWASSTTIVGIFDELVGTISDANDYAAEVTFVEAVNGWTTWWIAWDFVRPAELEQLPLFVTALWSRSR